MKGANALKVLVIGQFSIARFDDQGMTVRRRFTVYRPRRRVKPHRRTVSRVRRARAASGNRGYLPRRASARPQRG